MELIINGSVYNMPYRIDEKLNKIIKRRFRYSFMSNAKWRKFFTLLDRPEFNIRQAIWKFIDGKTEIRGWFTKSDELMEKYVGDYGLGPFAYKHIEWIEIPYVGKPRGFENIPFKHWNQDVKNAKSLLDKNGLWEMEETENGLKIYGFKE